MSSDFDAIVNGTQFDAPQMDPRKSGIFYLASSADGSSVYDLVIANRVVAHIIVSAEAVKAPEALMAAFIEGSTAHPVLISSVDGSTVIPTDGWTIKAPGGFPSRTLVKAYVMPRLAELLVRLHGIGLPLV